jgi:hypothetical protein
MKSIGPRKQKAHILYDNLETHIIIIVVEASKSTNPLRHTRCELSITQTVWRRESRQAQEMSPSSSIKYCPTTAPLTYNTEEVFWK